MYTFVKMLHNILGWNIMHIQQNINTDVEINSLTDLPKLKVLLESSNMKINKSQLARELGVDRRTVDKYLDGYTRKTTRNKSRSEEHTSELQSRGHLVCRLLLENKKQDHQTEL